MITKKVAMLGSWGVGKTSLVKQFVYNVYDDKYLSTLGVKIDTKVVSSSSGEIKLMLWDIAGAEENFNVPMHYINGAAAYLLVVDGTRAESLTAAVELATKIDNEIGPLPFVVALNKNDLECQIDLAQTELALAAFAPQVFSTSAKTGEQVEAVFMQLSESLLNNNIA